MDREAALDFLKTVGFTKLLRAAGRVEEDSDHGYGPALDAAFAYYDQLYPGTYPVNPLHTLGFTELLKAATLDMVVPSVCVFVDTQVDAPLTRVSGSQLCKQAMQMQANAWSKAAGYGYGGMMEIGGFSVNVDYAEVDPWIVGGE